MKRVKRMTKRERRGFMAFVRATEAEIEGLGRSEECRCCGRSLVWSELTGLTCRYPGCALLGRCGVEI